MSGSSMASSQRMIPATYPCQYRHRLRNALLVSDLILFCIILHYSFASVYIIIHFLIQVHSPTDTGTYFP